MVLLLNLLSKSFKEAHFLQYNFSPCRATDSVSPHLKIERASWTEGGGEGGGSFLAETGLCRRTRWVSFFDRKELSLSGWLYKC